MSTATPKPYPGSKEARAIGCTCPVLDNAYGRGVYDNDKGEPQFWVDEACPVHAPAPVPVPVPLTVPLTTFGCRGFSVTHKPETVEGVNRYSAALILYPNDTFPEGTIHEVVLASDYDALAARLKAHDTRCTECNGELSACGAQGDDGEPSMDCKYCIIAAELHEAKAALRFVADTADTSQTCSPGNEAIAMRAIDALVVR